MRVYFIVSLLFMGTQAWCQVSTYPFTSGVKFEGQARTAVAVDQVDSNTILSVFANWRQNPITTTHISLLDSCGVLQKTTSLELKPFGLSSVIFRLQKFADGWLVVVSRGAGEGSEFLFFDDNLNLYAATTIEEYHDYRMEISQVGKDALLVHNGSVFGNFWYIWPRQKKAEHYKFRSDAYWFDDLASDDLGNIYVTGHAALGGGTNARVFLSKLNMDLSESFYSEYLLVNTGYPAFSTKIMIEDDGNASLLARRFGHHLAYLVFNKDGRLINKKNYLIGPYNMSAAFSNQQGHHLGLISDRNNGGNNYVYVCDQNQGISFFKVDTRYNLNHVHANFNGFGYRQSSIASRTEFRANGSGCKLLVENEIDTSTLNWKSNPIGSFQFIKDDDKLVFHSVEQTTVADKVEWTLLGGCINVVNRFLPTLETVVCEGAEVKLNSRLTSNWRVWNTGDTSKSISPNVSGIYFNQGQRGFCSVYDTQKLEILAPVSFDVPANPKVCEYDTFTFSPKNQKHPLEWTFPDGRKEVSFNVSSIDTGWHRVRSNGLGCEYIDSFFLEKLEVPQAKAGPDGKICKGDTITLKGDGGETYLWTPADFLNDDRLKNPKAFPPNTQLYRVVVTSREGCHDTDFVNLLVNPKPVAGFLPMPANASIADKGVLFSNLGSNSSDYKWFVNQVEQTQEANFNFLFPDTGDFQIMLLAASPEGCADSTLWQLRVDAAPLMFIPNAFTPNGDGLNDEFTPSSFYYDRYEMTIFTKWGQRIWKSRDASPFPVWDARLDKSLETVPVGTYLYVIKGKSQDGGEYEFSGKVHVVK